MEPMFEVKRAANGEYHFILQSANGEPILSSETYTLKNGALSGIDSVKQNAPFDSRYDRKMAVNGQYYFVLKAANGEPIGTSEMYSSSSARDNGIAAVKRDAPRAAVKDLT